MSDVRLAPASVDATPIKEGDDIEVSKTGYYLTHCDAC